MKPLRVAVIGAGPMGRLHAQTVARRQARVGDCVLVAVVDRHRQRAERLADAWSAASATEATALSGIEAAIVAVPTAAHEPVAVALLDAGLDLLIEKPLAIDSLAAVRIAERAAARNSIVQVGHVEWYNSVWREAFEKVGEPVRVVVERLQPRSPRGLDVDVVQDLMLHDLDWVVRAVGSEAELVSARGLVGKEGAIDEAEARIRFASGCVAHLRASRMHGERVRRLAVEGRRGVTEVDFSIAGRGADPDFEDPLARQWHHFLAAVSTRSAPENDARVGVAALAWVERVRARIRAGGGGA